MRQVLPEPTAGGSMVPSFEYDLAFFAPAGLTVLLDDPALENLFGADLESRGTPATAQRDIAFIGLGSISLTAVMPEPFWAWIVLLAFGHLAGRRRRPRDEQSAERPTRGPQPGPSF